MPWNVCVTVLLKISSLIIPKAKDPIELVVEDKYSFEL